MVPMRHLLREVRRELFGASMCVVVLSACGGGGATTDVTPVVNNNGGFTLTSGSVSSGGVLSTTYTCDGASKSPPLAWTGAPSGTAGYAMLMTTIPGPGTVKYNWLLYGISAGTNTIAENTTGGATVG